MQHKARGLRRTLFVLVLACGQDDKQKRLCVEVVRNVCVYSVVRKQAKRAPIGIDCTLNMVTPCSQLKVASRLPGVVLFAELSNWGSFSLGMVGID